MKRTLGLILVLVLALGCVFSFASCKKESAIYGLVASASPTKTVTLTDYTAADGTIYEGEFIMSVEGNNSIFYFHYQRPSTVEEGMADVEAGKKPASRRELEGNIYFKDGKFSEDGDQWTAEAPSTTIFSFDLKAEYLTGATTSDDGNTLTAEMTPEKAVKVLGTDLQPQGNVKITVKTNGVSLSKVVLQYVTADGASVTIDTSYTYNNVVLVFPEA